jgi:hypothetical protein
MIKLKKVIMRAFDRTDGVAKEYPCEVKGGFLNVEENGTGFKVWGYMYDPEQVLQGIPGIINSAEYVWRDWRFFRVFFENKEQMDNWIANPVYVLGKMF